MLNILITGGYGFIGSALIRPILSETNHRVINVDALTYAGNKSSVPQHLKKNNYNFENLDIRNLDKVDSIFKKYKPDIVMHLAAESHVDRSIDSPSDFLTTNVLGTFNMLECSRTFYNSLQIDERKRFKFHHISTDEVYGDLGSEDKPFTEENSYKPSSPYSASKASSDHLVRSWARTYDLPAVISNCSNNYGPFHFPEKLIPHMILNAIHGKDMPIYGDGMQIRDWLYVEDHAKALLKVATEGVSGETYNIGGNCERTNLEVVELICEMLECSSHKKPSNVKKYSELITFVEDRPGHDRRYAIDSSKIKDSLGWAPRETFESGLKKTINWYIDNPSWWKKLLSSDYKLKRIGKNE